jgi:WD40 repeat protein
MQEVGVTSWELDGHVHGLAFMPEGDACVVGRQLTARGLRSFLFSGQGPAIDVLDSQQGKSTRRISWENPDLRDLLLTRDGKLAIVAGAGTVAALDVATGEQKYVLPEEAVMKVSLSPDSTTLATNHGTVVRTWDALTGAPKHTFEGHESWVSCMAYSPAGDVLLTGDVGGDVWGWDLTTGEGKIRLAGESTCQALAYADETNVLYASGAQLFRWDVAANSVTTLSNAPLVVSEMHLSPDGKTMVMTTRESVWLIDPFNGRSRLVLKRSSRLPDCVTFTPDGKTLVVAWSPRTDAFSTGRSEICLYHSLDATPAPIGSVGPRQDQAVPSQEAASE